MTLSDQPDSLLVVLADVISERHQQVVARDEHLPNGTSGHDFRREADGARRSREKAERGIGLTWFHVMREAFWTAMSTTDSAKLRTALIRLAATAVAWAEQLDERSEPDQSAQEKAR